MFLKKFVLVLIVLLSSYKVFGQTMTYTFVDPCTKDVTLFTVPVNGTVVVFLNTSKFFTAQDVSNGSFGTWINQVYQSYRERSPCSQQQGQVTQNNITTSIISNTVQSVVGSIMSSAQGASTNSGGSDAGGKNNKSNNKKKNSSTGSTNTSGSESSNSSSTNSNGDNGGGNTSTGNSSGTQGNGNGSTNGGGGDGNSSSGSSGSGGNSSSGSSGSGGNGGGNSGGSNGSGSGSSGNGGGNSGGSGSGSTPEGSVGQTPQNTGTGSQNPSTEGSEVAATTTMNVDSHNDNGGESSSGGGKGGGRSNPILVSSDLTTAQNMDRTYTPIINVSASSASLTGSSSYGLTAMVWLDFNQYALSGRYTRIHFNKSGSLKFVHNLNATGVYTYGNILAFVGYSGILNAGKFGVTGFNVSGAATIITEDKSGYYSPSITAFYTRPLKVNQRLTISPELYVISTPLVYSTKDQVTITDRYFSGFIGSGFDFQLSKRFKFNANYKANMSTNPEFPILSFFLIGSKINL